MSNASVEPNLGQREHFTDCARSCVSVPLSQAQPSLTHLSIPLTAAIVILFVLHRRLVQKQRREEVNDKHGSLDFGLGESPRFPNSRKNRKAPEMTMSPDPEKMGRSRGVSMDLSGPYILPGEVQHSRASFHSMSRSAHDREDPYRPSTFIKSDRDPRHANSLFRKDSMSSASNSTSDKSSYVGRKNLLRHAERPAMATPPSRSAATTPVSSSPPMSAHLESDQMAVPPMPNPVQYFHRQQLQTVKEAPETIGTRYSAMPESSVPSRKPEPLRMPEPVYMPSQTSQSNIGLGLSFSPSPSSTTSPTPRSASPAQSQAASRRGSGNLAPSHAVRTPSSVPTLADSIIPEIVEPTPETEKPQPDFFAAPETTSAIAPPPVPPSRRSSRKMKGLSLNTAVDSLVPVEEASDAQETNLEASTQEQRLSALPYADILGIAQTPKTNSALFEQAAVEAMPGMPRRFSTGAIRPLPPHIDSSNENPEQRANRIRSFYKEYFDDSAGHANAGPTYYEDYDAAYGEEVPQYDPVSGLFYSDRPFAHDPHRRAMTPPPRAPPRLRGAPGRNGSMGSFAHGARAFSSASGRIRARLPPPKPLNNLPSPHHLKQDIGNFSPIDFAPPQVWKDRQTGRAMSPGMEQKPYSPSVRAFTPLYSSFDDLSIMPSPHSLRRSGVFHPLDFAPPSRFKNANSSANGSRAGSETGSIKSARSGLSAFQAANIRNGAYRVSRMPTELVGTRQDTIKALAPSWDMVSKA
ncbi:hypothetical protein MRB53_036866 [Persea americana]|nr:hypothetical protein MRB53_036866 [Persea americana]